MKILTSTHFDLVGQMALPLQVSAVDGKIYVIDPSNRAIIRLTATGEPDKSFDTDAIGYFPENTIAPFQLASVNGELVARGTSLPFSYTGTYVSTVTVPSSGIPAMVNPTQGEHVSYGGAVSYVESDAAGNVYFAPTYDNGASGYIAKLRPAGSLDGIFTTNATAAVARAELVLRDFIPAADGGLYLVGEQLVPADYTTNTPQQLRGVVMKLLPSGDIDPSFGKSGLAAVGGKDAGQLMQVVAMPNGDLTVAYTGSENPASVTRLHADGSVDVNFGQNGVAQLPMPGLGVELVTQLVTDGEVVFAILSNRYGDSVARIVPITESGFDDAAIDVPIGQLIMNATGIIDTSSRLITLASKEYLGTDVDIATIDYADVFAIHRNGATIQGSIGADHIVGGAEDNLILATFGNDRVDGGAGLDIMRFQGTYANFSLERTQAGDVVATDATRREGTAHLFNIERLEFADAHVALDIDGGAGQAFRLYRAAFDRQPDAVELGYWMKVLDSGVALNDVAGGFVASDEFRAAYAAAADNASIVTQFYKNILHREADEKGLLFWAQVLDNKLATPAEVLASFSESPENQAAVIDIIGNGMAYTPWMG